MLADRKMNEPLDHLFQEAELEEHFDRSSGPGGQNVNKVSTKVTLRDTLRAHYKQCRTKSGVTSMVTNPSTIFQWTTLSSSCALVSAS